MNYKKMKNKAEHRAKRMEQKTEDKKLFVLCPTREFNLLAINFPNLRIRR